MNIDRLRDWFGTTLLRAGFAVVTPAGLNRLLLARLLTAAKQYAEQSARNMSDLEAFYEAMHETSETFRVRDWSDPTLH